MKCILYVIKNLQAIGDFFVEKRYNEDELIQFDKKFSMD